MHDPSSLRSKAEASLRLAELAKTPRARELFRELADEYERRARGELTAELIEQAEAAPSLVPVAPLLADVPIAMDAPPTADAAAGPGALVAAEASLVPAAPVSESRSVSSPISSRFAKRHRATDCSRSRHPVYSASNCALPLAGEGMWASIQE